MKRYEVKTMDDTIDRKVEPVEIKKTVVKDQSRCPYYIQCPTMKEINERCKGAYELCRVYHELKETYENVDQANLMVGG